MGRFEREAQALAALQHPHIAGIHDLVEHEGARYLVLELVPGETLAARIARGPVPLDEALPMAPSTSSCPSRVPADNRTNGSPYALATPDEVGPGSANS